MSQTPVQTPITKKSNKKLPMIVDIALDDSGKQLYQVHESNKFVRKEMPKSIKFNSNSLVDEEYEEKTPIRKILGTISPSTLNQKKLTDEDEEDSNITETESTKDTSLPQEFFYDPMNYDYDDNPKQNTNESELLSNKSNDIWPDDVEQAFEEVLSIIPKNGLNKIKISGRSCGRNELISDYILTKTGKFRTRKQVSSHIQVIKNLGQKQHIIRLINDGPSFRTEQEQIQNTKKFEEIFLKITLNKSLGFNKTSKRLFEAEGSEGDKKQKRPRSRPNPLNLHQISLSFDNFYMSVDNRMGGSPLLLTLYDNEDIKNLKLKPNANISNRFPDLENLTSLNIPILHNLVKLKIPSMSMDYSISQGLKTNLVIRSDATTSHSIFTIIYSHGKEFYKINENEVKFNEDYSFLNKFWKFYLSNEVNSEFGSLHQLTIKQILYEKSFEKSANNVLKIPKLQIRGVFLWEFVKVDDTKDAVTTTSKLVFQEPTPLMMEGIQHQLMPQAINYNSAINPNFYDTLGPSTGTSDMGYTLQPVEPYYQPDPKKKFHPILDRELTGQQQTLGSALPSSLPTSINSNSLPTTGMSSAMSRDIKIEAEMALPMDMQISAPVVEQQVPMNMMQMQMSQMAANYSQNIQMPYMEYDYMYPDQFQG